VKAGRPSNQLDPTIALRLSVTVIMTIIRSSLLIAKLGKFYQVPEYSNFFAA
jgi:hypothetical protein